MEAVKIKDFIIDLSLTKEPSVANKKSVAPKVNYSIVLENDMDFVIKRTTAKTDKDLVFLVSQDLFYVKNNNDNTVIQLDYDNYKRQISSFLRDMGMWLNFEKVSWTDSCFTENLYKMFSDETSRILIKHGISSNSLGYCKSDVARALKSQPKIIKYYFSKFTSINGNTLEAILYLAEEYDYNNAKYFIDAIDDVGRGYINGYNLKDVLNLAKGYNCNINTLIDYVVRGLYSQGIDEISRSIYSTYNDYLNMTNSMKGKVKNKYPKYLKTEHDKLVMRFNLWKRYRANLEVLKITEDHRKLEYKDREYCIILPESSADIVDEGVNLSHCVASYVKRVANGDTLILFMRDVHNIEESLVTIEVKNDTVYQAKGYANRGLTKEEKQFVNKWAKLKELKVNY